jgi:NTP pyrophosphatase (non-canonical NTP hydrolase)
MIYILLFFWCIALCGLSTPLTLASQDSLETMTQQVVRQMDAYSKKGTKKWTYKTAIKDLPVQVGSLSKLMMQLEGERYAHGMEHKEIKGKMADELADILSLVLFIAHELSIDMNEAWRMMLASDENKFVTRKWPSS